MKPGIERIKDERARHLSEEGWNETADDEYESGQLSHAAYCYEDAGLALAHGVRIDIVGVNVPEEWPFPPGWWKPWAGAERCFEKAGALFLAEAARIRREATPREELATIFERAADRVAGYLDTNHPPYLREMRVFRLNDCEWWLGYDLDSIIAEAALCYGVEVEDVQCDPAVLTDKELDETEFLDGFDEHGEHVRRPFREQRSIVLEKRFPVVPMEFATTEM